MRVVVLGGTGVVGPGVVSALHEAGCRVVSASRGVTAADLPEGVEVVRVDRSRVEEYADLIAAHRPDALIDLTCYTPQDAAVTVAAAAGVDRVIVVSSVSAVGGSSDTPISEAAATPPVCEYGWAKLAAERAMETAWSEGTSRALVVRLGGVYRTGGPLDGQLAEDGYWLRHLLAGERAVLADDGVALWNLLHARDAGRALLALLRNPSAHSTKVLLGSRRPFPWHALYERVHRAYGMRFAPISLPAGLIRERIPESEFLDEASRWDQVYDLTLLEALAPGYEEREEQSGLVEAACWLVGAGRLGDPDLADRIRDLAAAG